jgi:hypothetical protein
LGRKALIGGSVLAVREEGRLTSGARLAATRERRGTDDRDPTSSEWASCGSNRDRLSDGPEVAAKGRGQQVGLGG